jgi:MFS family permease
MALTFLVLERTDNGVAIGLINLAQFGPILVFGTWAGVLADRLDRWRLLMGVQVAGLIIATGMVIAVWSEMALWVFFALATLSGCAKTVDIPVRKALISDIVPTENVSNAVGLSSAVAMAAKVVGPTLAGALLAGPGLLVCFAAGPVLFGLVFATFLMLDRASFLASERVMAAPGQIVEGIKYAWRAIEIRVPLIIVFGIGTMSFNFQVILPLFSIRELAGSEATYTALFAAMSLGSLGGALFVASRRRVTLPYVVRSGWAMALATLVLAAAPSVQYALPVIFVVGVFSMSVMAGSSAIVQVAAAPSVRGRVLAIHALVFVSSTPLGGPLLGFIAERFGSRTAILIGAVSAGFFATFAWVASARLQLKKTTARDSATRSSVATTAEPAHIPRLTVPRVPEDRANPATHRRRRLRKQP